MTRDQAIKLLEDRIQAADDSRQSDIPLPCRRAEEIVELLNSMPGCVWFKKERVKDIIEREDTKSYMREIISLIDRKIREGNVTFVSCELYREVLVNALAVIEKQEEKLNKLFQ